MRWAFLRSIFKRKWAKPSIIFFFLLTPILLSLLLWAVFSPGRKFQPLKMAVINEDQGIASRIVLSFLSSPKAKKWIEITEADREQAFKRLRENKISAIMVFPRNFTENYVQGKTTTIKLIKNPAQRIYPEVAATLMLGFEKILNFLRAYYDEEFSALSRGEVVSGEFLKGTLQKTEELFRSIASFPFKIREEREEKKRLSRAIFFLSGLGYFFMLFFSNASITSMVGTRERQVQKRLFVSGISPFQYSLAYHLSSIAFVFLLELALAAAGWLLFRPQNGNPLTLLVIFLLFSVGSVSFFGVMAGIIGDEKKVNNLSSFFIFLFAILGGSFLPLSALPQTLRKLSFLSLIHPFNQATLRVMMGKEASGFLLHGFILSAALFFLSLYLNERNLRLK